MCFLEFDRASATKSEKCRQEWLVLHKRAKTSFKVVGECGLFCYVISWELVRRNESAATAAAESESVSSLALEVGVWDYGSTPHWVMAVSTHEVTKYTGRTNHTLTLADKRFRKQRTTNCEMLLSLKQPVGSGLVMQAVAILCLV